MNTNPSQSKKTDHLSPEQVAAMEELGLALKVIYLRLKRDGYKLVDGKFIKLEGDEEK